MPLPYKYHHHLVASTLSTMRRHETSWDATFVMQGPFGNGPLHVCEHGCPIPSTIIRCPTNNYAYFLRPRESTQSSGASRSALTRNGDAVAPSPLLRPIMRSGVRMSKHFLNGLTTACNHGGPARFASHTVIRDKGQGASTASALALWPVSRYSDNNPRSRGKVAIALDRADREKTRQARANGSFDSGRNVRASCADSRY